MSKTQFATKRLQIDVKVYKSFIGKNHKLMQRLLSGRENNVQLDTPRLPISPKQLMEVRLGISGKEGDQTYLRKHFVDTNTAVLSNPSGEEVKYSPKHPLIYGLNEKTKLVDGILPITQDQYEISKGFVLNAEQAKALRNNLCGLPSVRRKFWEFAAEGDTKLADDYIKDVEKRTRMKFNNIMGLYLPSIKGLSLLSVDGIDDDYRSDASGDDYLGDDGGCLVGVAAEPQEVSAKLLSLETRVQ